MDFDKMFKNDDYYFRRCMKEDLKMKMVDVNH